MEPKLSVVIPTYHRLEWLRGAVDSVLEPGLDCELVVLDNGSPDGTWAYLQARAAEDARLRPVHWEVNDPAGAYPALLEMARGQYVTLFADDDRMLPGGLARKMAVLDAEPGTVLVFSAARCMDAEGRDLGEADWTRVAEQDFPGRKGFFETLIVQNCVPQPAAMFRRSAASVAILRDRAFDSSHDWPFWLDLARRGAVAYLRQPTVALRLHGDQVSAVTGFGAGRFIEVALSVWRRWMLDADPPFVPSRAVLLAMRHHLTGLLQATHGPDIERIQEGLRRLQALREEQEARIAALQEAGEAAQPEAFLLAVEALDGPWTQVARIFLDTFGPPDRAFLRFVAERPEVAQGLRERLAPLGGGDRVAVLEAGQLLEGIRPFAHLQWIGAAGMQGRRGGRLAAALDVPPAEENRP